MPSRERIRLWAEFEFAGPDVVEEHEHDADSLSLRGLQEKVDSLEEALAMLDAIVAEDGTP